MNFATWVGFHTKGRWISGSLISPREISSIRMLTCLSAQSTAILSPSSFGLEFGLFELQRTGILPHGADLVVGKASLAGGGDLDGDLQLHVFLSGEMLQHLAVKVSQRPHSADRVSVDTVDAK